MPPARILLLASLVLPLAAFAAAAPAAAADDDDDRVVALPAFDFVDSALEDFGLQVRRGARDPARSSMLWPVRVPQIVAVLPNTAAARAGIRPGEFILKADGKSASSTLFSPNTWRKLQDRKLNAVAAATKPVTWTLELRSADGQTTRTVPLTVPTPAPRWGEAPWRTPVGRIPVDVSEAGPFAERARLVLNHGIWTLFSNSILAQAFGWKLNPAVPLRGYQWSIVDAEDRRHRIFVTQQHGHTEIMLEVWSRETGQSNFLTSPAGALEKVVHRTFSRGTAGPSPEQNRARFEQELNFWLKEVTDQSARWPLELKGGIILGSTMAAPNTSGAPRSAAKADGPLPGPRAAQFLHLPQTTGEQRSLFEEAFAKVGADEENWAYTETSRGLDDNHQTVVRVDPSKPEGQRVTLLKYDGKPPTAAQLKTWRDQGRDVAATLGDLPPLTSVIDFTDLRVAADETAAVVFELPIVAGNADFPADKFQALFRVNKTRRSLEDIVVKMREAIKVAGLVKITDAGLEAHFRTLDPASPPQPVALKAGGAARLLLVKISRSFEATRTDYVRVQPYVDPAAPATAP
jgi:hypothetical protein